MSNCSCRIRSIRRTTKMHTSTYASWSWSCNRSSRVVKDSASDSSWKASLLTSTSSSLLRRWRPNGPSPVTNAAVWTTGRQPREICRLSRPSSWILQVKISSPTAMTRRCTLRSSLWKRRRKKVIWESPSKYLEKWTKTSSSTSRWSSTFWTA